MWVPTGAGGTLRVEHQSGEVIVHSALHLHVNDVALHSSQKGREQACNVGEPHHVEVLKCAKGPGHLGLKEQSMFRKCEESRGLKLNLKWLPQR